MSDLQRLVLALSSAVLLILSFPNFNQSWCAWIALVPWLVLLRGTPPRAALRWSYLIGLCFFLASIWWLVHVTVIGWLILCAYLATYFGIFGWVVAVVHVWDRRQETGDMSHVPRLMSHPLLFVPALWTALEYARSHLLSGFGWNLLAYSQVPFKPVIQCADITGAWGVSFLILLVNAAIAEALKEFFRAPSRVRSGLWSAAIGVGALLAALGYGVWRLHHLALGPTVRVAVVQGNIPQAEKWDAAYIEKIQQRYTTLTQHAAATKPDLIVWPETSVPGYLGVDETLTQWVSGVAAQMQRPLLVGAPILRLNAAQAVLMNSAVLLDPQGIIRQQHDKLHLVPFGEFIPFEPFAPWLRMMLPPIGDFAPGHAYTVLQLSSRLKAQGSRQEPDSLQPSAFSLQPRFSVLICFEDIFPEMARRFVRQGAQLLLVITNDAWFGPTAAAYQHAQASTLRAVELRVPVARAANTGWSGCIDATGRWTGSVDDAQGRELFIDGTHTCDLTMGFTQTLYLRWGDWFTFLCVIVIGIMIVYGKRPS